MRQPRLPVWAVAKLCKESRGHCHQGALIDQTTPTRDVCPVTVTVERIRVGVRLVEAVVGIAHKVIPRHHAAPGADAPTSAQVWVSVIDARVDGAHLHAFNCTWACIAQPPIVFQQSRTLAHRRAPSQVSAALGPSWCCRKAAEFRAVVPKPRHDRQAVWAAWCGRGLP